MYYYTGSLLPIEWTAQHGCGANAKEHCEIIIQYGCEDTMDPNGDYRSGSFVGAPRDGTPSNSQDAATDTIPTNQISAVASTVDARRYGMHENLAYYNKCRQRRRNMGLFHADQKLRRRDARATRQNPNGNRNGLECPEERDYYPYWHPTPWIDVAVLTDHPERCTDYMAESENVKARGECTVPASATEQQQNTAEQLRNQGRFPNNQFDCEGQGFTWVTSQFGLTPEQVAAINPQPVDCQGVKFSRINHLGNANATNYDSDLSTAEQAVIPHADNAHRYVWKVPNHVQDNCVLRIRYNISTADYPAWMETPGVGMNTFLTPGLNSSFDGEASPIQQDPYVPIGSEDVDFVSLAVNTNQYSRTFQDRSYVFHIKARPAEIPPTSTIVNMNVRGKRGNIVQTYPAVEYDFVPNDVNIPQNEYIHFQWTGSDYNPRRGCNNAEGGPPDPNTPDAANLNSRADRSNIVEMNTMAENYPKDIVNTNTPESAKSMFCGADGTVDAALRFKMAFLGQKEELAARSARCLTEDELDAIRNKNARENHPQNCAKINAKFNPYFDGGAVQMRCNGVFPFFSSRNNNFSNRDQTGRVCVGTVCSQFADAGDPVPPDFGFQIPADRIQQAAIITQETFLFNEKDNDAFGDGEAQDCEEMKYFFDGISAGAAVALAIGMMFVGVAATITAQYISRRYFKGGDLATACAPKKSKRPASSAAARDGVKSWAAVAGSHTTSAASVPAPPPRRQTETANPVAAPVPPPAPSAGAIPAPPPRR
jgi:hypothetical protein